VGITIDYAHESDGVFFDRQRQKYFSAISGFISVNYFAYLKLALYFMHV
jgi:hypothetical protein